jgi:YMGG-like Gly-zipper
MNRSILAAMAIASLVGFGACTNMSEPQQGALSGAALGAGSGALIGAIAGDAGVGALVGAGVGAAGGYVAGKHRQAEAQY